MPSLLKSRRAWAIALLSVLGVGLLLLWWRQRGEPTIVRGNREPTLSRNTEATLSGHTGAVFGLGFTPDGKTLASASADETVRLWDVASGKTRAVLRGHDGWVDCLAVSPDGTLVASGGSDCTVRLWDVATGEQRASFKGLIGPVHSLAFSPDGKLLAVAGEGEPDPIQSTWAWGQLKVWDVAATKEVTTLLKQIPGVVSSVAFAPDGKTLASGCIDIELWDTASWKVQGTLEGHGPVDSLVFSRDGRLLASASHDFTAKLWDVSTRQKPATLAGHRHDVYSVALTADGDLLATASEDNTVKLWDVKSRKELLTLAGTPGKRTAWCVAFSPDGNRLAAGMAYTIRLWDVRTVLDKRD